VEGDAKVSSSNQNLGQLFDFLTFLQEKMMTFNLGKYLGRNCPFSNAGFCF
jgi:hypothetical protein